LNKYQEYLEQQYTHRTARERYNYARKYADCLLSGNFSKLKTLSDDKRAHVLKALSALSKYLGIYQQFKALVKDYGLKWGGRSSDDVLIDRLTKVEDPGEVYDWIREVCKARPELSDFMEFMAVTGLRFREAITSWNLIINLDREGKIGEYYNFDNEILEHYKFKETFIRHTKKAFMSFLSKEFLYRIIGEKQDLTRATVNKRLQNADLPLRFGDIREAHATFMIQFLKQPEIDFLHGRVSASVFMKNYFNPALIADLKSRAFRGVHKIMRAVWTDRNQTDLATLRS